MGKILVVDDDSSIVVVIKALLTRAGHKVLVAENGNDALDILTSESPDMLITNVTLPGIDGITLLRSAKKMNPKLEAIVMSSYSDVDNAMNAMKNGASDYLVKPFSFDALISNIDRSLSGTQTIGTATGSHRRSLLKYHCNFLIGESPCMMDLYRQLESKAPSPANLLIVGPQGTGRNLCARAIHSGSLRACGPFISVNCAAYDKGGVEQELFGMYSARKGLERNGFFVMADGGTLMLQNIDTLPKSSQVKIVDILTRSVFFAPGVGVELPIDVRILASTSKSVEELLAANFNPELLALLTTQGIIRMPSLAERKSDIQLIIMKILGDIEFDLRRLIAISPEAAEALEQRDWSDGNIDALSAYMYLIMKELSSNRIEAQNLLSVKPADIRARIADVTRPYTVYLNSKKYTSAEFSVTMPPEQMPLKPMLHRFEMQYVLRIVAECGGDKEMAAKRLGISMATLYRKIDE